MNFCIIEKHDEQTTTTNHHCLYINNLNAFLSIKQANKRTFPCETCVNIFYDEVKLQEHIPLCRQL